MPATFAAQPSPRPWPGEANFPRSLLAILAAFVALTLVYSVTVPLGETPDELAHYQYVRYLDARGRPPLTAQDRLQSGYKGHEPPLYYLLLQRATAWLRVAERPMLKLLDPDLQPRHSIPDEVMLWNAVLHTEDERFPWQGTALAWHVLRLFSIPLGMLTILATYGIVCCLFPARPGLALAAAGLNAFTPQFVYISAVLNNDNLAVPLSVWSLWVLVRMAGGDLRWREFVLLGVLIGLARITKFFTLILLPITLLALLLIAWRYRRWGRCLLGGLLMLALILAVTAPWIMAVQPDDPATAPQGALGFGLKLLDIVHTDRIVRSRGIGAAGGGLAAFPAMVLSFFRLEPGRWASLLFESFWAYYGPMTVEADAALYVALLALMILAALGGLALLVRRRQVGGPASLRSGTTRLGLALVLLQGVAFLALEALFYTIMRRLPDTAQGRHLFSAMPAWMLLLAGGLLAWWPPRHDRWAVTGLLTVFGGLSLYCLPAYVLPAYAPPVPVRTTLPASWQPQVALSQAAAPGIRALGYSPVTLEVAAGQEASVTLLWQADTPIAPEYWLRLSYRDAEGGERLLRLAQPLNGRWPTRAWDPGDYIRDVQPLAIPPGLPAGEYTLQAQWVERDLTPLGPALPAGTLRVIEGEAVAQAPTLQMQGAEDGTLRYRQALALTATTAVGETPPPLRLINGAQPWLPLATETYPTENGTTTRAFFLVSGATLPGTYRLDAANAELTLNVQGRVRAFTLPDGFTPLEARFGEALALVGYRLEDGDGRALEASAVRLQPGQTLNLKLAWQATDWVSESYTVFTHLLDGVGQVRAQYDQIPQFNYATLFWVPGEVVVDLYPLTLAADAPTGVYTLELGLYQRRDNTRLPVSGPAGSRDTRWLLGPIQVIQP